MHPWLAQIGSVQKKESKLNSSRWIQLATIGIDNTPRVRTVVFRGWSESYEMEIYIDERSLKTEELDLNNNVEVCWLFSKSKCQFRLRGKSRIDASNDTVINWIQVSANTKSMWYWPTPGHIFVDEKTNKLQVKNIEKPVKNFVLLKG